MASRQPVVQSFGDSYIGTRRNNEDALGKREPTDALVREQRGLLYVVSDGMGGHASGEIASRMAVKLILSQYYSDTRPAEESLIGAIREASRRIYEIAGDATETEGMGCTVVACAVLNDCVAVANVGDSRAYRLRHSQLTLLTVDDRSDPENRHMLARAVGVRPDVEVNVVRCDWEPNDRFLLCTDGLTNSLSETEIAATMSEATSRQAVTELLRRAAEQKANDNCTAIVIALQAEPHDDVRQSEMISSLDPLIAPPPSSAENPEKVSLALAADPAPNAQMPETSLAASGKSPTRTSFFRRLFKRTNN